MYLSYNILAHQPITTPNPNDTRAFTDTQKGAHLTNTKATITIAATATQNKIQKFIKVIDL